MGENRTKEEQVALQAKLKEAFNDKGFVEKVSALDTPEEVQAALKERGIDFSVEEVVALREAVEKAGERGDDLTDEELEEITGGVSPTPIIPLITGIVTIMAPAFTRRRW